MVRLMIGRDVSRFYQRSRHTPGEEVLSVRDLRVPANPRHTVSFSVRAGEVVGLAGLVHGSDLVLTGEGAFDFQSRSGKVPYGVAEVAAAATVPCVALAGQVLVGSREMRALGVESAYSLVDLVGEERAFAAPADALAELAERTARTWSR